MKSKTFEGKMLKFIDVLNEVGLDTTPTDPAGSGTKGVPAPQQTTGQQPGAGQQATGQQPGDAQQTTGQEVSPYVAKEKTEYDPSDIQNKKVQYLDTHDLFTTQYPTNSSEWVDEVRKKKYYLPLKDGRVGRYLVKKLKDLVATGPNGAARYNEFQFRIILRGDLNAKTTISIVANDDNTASAKLEDITLNTLHGVETKDKSQITTFKIPKIDITCDNSKLIKWAKQESTGRTATEFEKTKAKEEQPEAPEEHEGGTAKSSPHKEDMEGTARNKDYVGMKTKEAERYVKWLLKNKGMPKDEQGAFNKVVNKSNIKEFKAAQAASESYTIDLQSYLKDLLLEKKAKPSGSALEKELGGELINRMNDTLFKNWFKQNGLAAPASNRIFEGCLFEFFAASEATFKPSEREVVKVKEDSVKLKFTGTLTAEAELWFDARIGENTNVHSWTFRDHTRPEAFKERSFKW